jgi:dTDP-glucose 4,6-dehydratase
MTRAVVTGGAGFLGSHLCERLLGEGWEVLCYDSLITGSEKNVAHLRSDPGFRFVNANVIQPISVEGHVDWVMHLASPASPADYLAHPIHTLKVNSIGTMNALGLAKAKGASFFLTSKSEFYRGNVNPVGPRGVYDEGKRFAEAIAMSYHREHAIPVRIARSFNTYGPRMRRRDGRAVPNFIDQSLKGERLTIHGEGSQTRSLCYVDDEIEGFWRFVNSDHTGPMNIGNPHEVTILRLAETIGELAGNSAGVSKLPRPVDDPEVRCPDIGLARRVLGWEPKVGLEEGLQRTIAWARSAWA